MLAQSRSILALATTLAFMLMLNACGPTSVPTANEGSTPVPASATPSVCAESSGLVFPSYGLVESGWQAEALWSAEFVPWWVRPSPDGRVLAVTDGGDAIYELKPDGTLEIAFECPGMVIETAVAASDGALWFATRDGGRLYRVDPQGSVRIVKQGGDRNLEAGLNGSVYAMENGLVRIDPDGTYEVITMEVSGRKFAIGPQGEIVALSDGNIVRISNSGDITQVASGYGPEPWLTFGPDGLLYVTHWTGVDVIDLESGTIEPIPWLENSNLSESGAFAPDGRLLMYHPNTDVYAIDLDAQTVEIYHQVISNSWAMASNPGEAVYVAFGTGRREGETTIYRILDDESLEPIVTVPYGLERAMAFDSQGVGYLAVGDPSQGAAIFRFDPLSEEIEEYIEPKCFPRSVVVHPQTGMVWWEECNRFVSLAADGSRVVIEGVPGGENASLEITPSGEFFTITFFHREDPGMPYEHGLYRWNADDAVWEQVADLTQSDPGITLATLTSCPDGHIYTVESLDSSNLPINRSSYNAVRRLEADGSLTLIGYDFAFDGLAADCDSATGRIIFTSGAGIFALTPP
jgi:sugar lactone lactonase YvrE